MTRYGLGPLLLIVGGVRGPATGGRRASDLPPWAPGHPPGRLWGAHFPAAWAGGVLAASVAAAALLVPFATLGQMLGVYVDPLACPLAATAAAILYKAAYRVCVLAPARAVTRRVDGAIYRRAGGP